MTTDNKELLRELADHTSDPAFVMGLSMLPNPDEVLRKVGLDHKVYDQVMTDPHVMAKVIDRRSGLLRREWVVSAGDDSPLARTAADLCNKALTNLENHEKYPLENSLGQLQEAALRGHRALEVAWEYTSDGFLPAFLRDIPNRRLTHDGEEWRLLTRNEPNFGIALPEKKILMATHMASTDNPYGEALLSRCYWPYMFKHSGLTWWVTLAEKHGIPWIIGKIGEAADEKTRRDLLNKLVALALDAVTVLPKDAELEFKGMQGVTPEVHERLIRISNSEMSKVLVGQTLSTEMDQKGGSRSAAETHSGLRDEIVEADSKLVGRVMNRLFAWITEINLGDSALAPEFEWVEENKPSRDWAFVAEKAIKSMPGQVPKRWAWEKFGIPEEMAADEMLPATLRPPATGKRPAAGDFARDNAAFSQDQQALEGLADKGIDDGVKGLAANEEKLLRAVLESESYEEAMDKLLALYPDMEMEDLEEALSRSLLAAGMFGQHTASGVSE